MNEKIYDVLIVGSGPAGLTAAIYAARARRRVLVLGGSLPGGQLMLTTDVEDFPGFKLIQGPELMEKMIEHALSFGIDFVKKDVVSVDFKKKPFALSTNKETYHSRTVILATGASAKWLGLESEKKLIGKGVSACAVCDAPFFKDMDVAVIGGGDTAMRESLHLAKVCKTVYVIHRREELRAQKALQDKALKTKNMKFILNTEVKQFIGEDNLQSLELYNNKTKSKSILEIQGAFVAIGHQPNTSFLQEHIALDEYGYIVVHDMVKTSVDGIFAAGDVHDYRYMQAVTAAGAGCMAAMDADHYLDH